MQEYGTYAGLLALTEVGLGSALHAAKVPLRGQFLSLNQIFLLSKASLDDKTSNSRCSPLTISCVAALLKTLAPIGNKLTPMLAISMQGLLFSLGIFCFGHTPLGRVIGAILSSFWAFIQPLLLYTAILSTNTFSFYYIPIEKILYVVWALVFLKVLFATSIALLASKIAMPKYMQYLEKTKIFFPLQNKPKSPIKGALKELFRPFFISIVLLVGVIAFLVTKSYIIFFLAIARPFAIAFILFFLMRLIPIENLITWIQKKRWHKIAIPLEVALSWLQSRNQV